MKQPFLETLFLYTSVPAYMSEIVVNVSPVTAEMKERDDPDAIATVRASGERRITAGTPSFTSYVPWCTRYTSWPFSYSTENTEYTIVGYIIMNSSKLKEYLHLF